jgi:hypothetical protein
MGVECRMCAPMWPLGSLDTHRQYECHLHESYIETLTTS